MRLPPTLLALALCAATLEAQDGPLTVIRHAPRDTASPGNIVTVTFDRPVAGRLDATVEADRIFRIEPAVAGRVEWRDPITIRFTPDTPLAPGAQFTVSVDTAFEALDGSRLERPYRFSFRVPGPRLLARSTGGPYTGGPDMLPLDGRVRLLFSAPVELHHLSRAHVELYACKAGERRVALVASHQRMVAEDDPSYIRYAGGWNRDTVADRYRRVVELQAAEPLPADCSGSLALPTTPDDARHGALERFAVSTTPSFRFEPMSCGGPWRCPMNHIVVRFTSPVKREDVLRHVRLLPSVPHELATSAASSAEWRIDLRLAPRSTYTVVASEELRDVHGRPLLGSRQLQVVTGDYHPAIGHAVGAVTVPRSGPRTVPLRHINVRTVRVISYTFAGAAGARVAASIPVGLDTSLLAYASRSETTLVTLSAPFNVERTTELALPSRLAATDAGVAVLAIDPVEDLASPEVEATVRAGRMKPIIVRPSARYRRGWGHLIVQLSDLAVHAKVGSQGGMVLVTGLGDGRPRARARVRQLDPDGNTLAQGVTGEDGVAELRPVDTASAVASRHNASAPAGTQSGTVLIEAVLGSDRVVTPVVNRTFDYALRGPLEPSQLGGRHGKPPAAAATLFADRGIYRPGEMLYLTGILREGTLSALTVPTGGDSVRLTIRSQSLRGGDDGSAVVRDTVLRMTEFGTVSDSTRLGTGIQLGDYVAELLYDGRTVARETLRVAEYRAPEFLVDVHADSTPRFGGDTVRAEVAGRYLFGAPMGRAAVSWRAVLHEVQPWALRIPGAEGWTVGEWDWWSGDGANARLPRQIGGSDSLDARGRIEMNIPLNGLRPSRPGRAEISVAVTDINRQVVTASTSVPVHPSRLYVLARRQSRGWYWNVGQAATVEIRTVRPDGRELADVPVVVSLAQREWRRDGRAGWTETVVRTDTIRTGERPVPFSFTPTAGGIYELRLVASDESGAVARTSLSGYALAAGSGWWAESPYHLPLVTERRELAVGDSAQVLFDSPFDLAEAWITVEREGILEHRRMLVRRGPNVVPLHLAEAHVPNVFVAVLLVRRTDGARASRPDSAARLMRAGYVELKVGAARKRLAVSVAARATEHGPGDTATVRIRVADAAGRPVRSEVTLWAVDEGVLALTGFTTPDPIARLYQPRGVGAPLASTLPGILTAHPELFMSLSQTLMARVGSSVQLEAVVATGLAAASREAVASLRKEFRSTAFYLARAYTDSGGVAEVRAKLPDNLTTYRVMAVAVDTSDRFGSGDTSLLVTRPLVARPSLPRFVRASDTLFAGAAVNVRDGAVRDVAVEAEVEGIELQGAPRRAIALAEGTGAEARFGLVVPPRDRATESVVVRLRASDGISGDAVETRLPLRPDFHPRTHTEIGAVRGSAEVVMDLPAGTDPARSRLTIRIGTTPLAPMLAAHDWLRVYPYDCTEQIASGGRALLAVWRATSERDPGTLGDDPRPRLQALADELARRQRADGAIRFWGDHPWSSPWLTTYAGLFLLEAREAGVVVDSAVLGRIVEYLTDAAEAPIDTGGINRYERRAHRLALGGRVAIVEFLRRSGNPDETAEDRLLALAAQMTWEDRVRLAEVLAPRHHGRALALLDAAWATATRAGRRVELPDSAIAEREFPSRVAPAARLLTATLALRPDHPLLGGLAEAVMQQGRAEGRWAWSTQDYASVVLALAALQGEDVAPREVRVQRGRRTLLARRIGAADSATAIPLDGLIDRGRDGRVRLRLTLASDAARAPVYYAVSVDEVPSTPPTTPDMKGIVVERWYERFSNGDPVTSVQEGELVRVRLRVTVPGDRQFVAVVDPLPAGLEPVDLSLKTSGTLQPFVTPISEAARAEGDRDQDGPQWQAWLYGRWEDGWWSPWEHKAMHDDKVVYFARALWPGSYTASYVARATTTGSFVRPPAHAEEMYNPAVQGRSDGGRFGVEVKAP